MSNTIEVTTEGDTIITVTPEGDVTVGVAYNPVAGPANNTNIGITRTNAAVTVTSSTGNDGTILAADATNAGVFTAANFTKLAGIEAGADVTDLTNVGAALTTAAAKNTIVDADLVNIQDSAASFAPKTTLWSLVKSTLKTYFDTLYPSGSGTVTGTNTGDQSIFKNVAVAGQSTVVADTTNDTLTLVAGPNITITTNALTDTVTITAPGGSGDVVGPASATNGAFALFDTTTGKLLKNGSVPGGAATLNVGTSAGTVAAGDDSRFTNARTPTAHASTHVTGGADAIQSATAAQNGLATSTQITKLDGIEAGADVTDATNVSAAGAVMKTLADAKGDLFVATAADTVTRLPIGVSNGQVLTVDSAETTGVKWVTPASSGGDVVGPASSTDNAFARFDSTTGKLLQNSTATLNDVGLAALDGVQFSATPTSTVGTAKAVWDTTDSCLSVGLNASVNALVGVDSHVQVYNDSASTMTVMQVVRQSGSSGTRLKVALALANTDATSATTIGVVAQSIASNSQGFIQTAGLLRGVNTNDFEQGDVLWLSATTAGLITNVKPTAPNHGVRIGYCIKKAGGAGIILIDILNGFELDELHDVKITAPIVNNSFLAYNATLSVWENKVDVPASQLTGTIDNARLAANITGRTSFSATDGSTRESSLGATGLYFTDNDSGQLVSIETPATGSQIFLTWPSATGVLLTNNSSLPAANLTGTIDAARLPSTLTSALTLPNVIFSGLSLTGAQATNTINLSTTWQTTGNPTLIYGRVTNTASGSTANLIDLGTVAGGSLFKVDKSGVSTFTNDVFGTVFYCRQSNQSVCGMNNTDGAGPLIHANQNGKIGFFSGTSFGGNVDAFFTRAAAATIQLGANNATTPTAQTIKAHNVATGVGANLILSGGTGSSANGNVSITGNAVISGLSLTLAQATNTLDLSTTWNTTGNPTLIYGRVTNTASGTTANLLDLGTVAGGSLLKIDKAGTIISGGVQQVLTSSSSFCKIVGANWLFANAANPGSQYFYVQPGQITISQANGTLATTLNSAAAATLQLGANAASAVNQTIKAHDVTSGAGANLILSGGTGSSGNPNGKIVVTSDIQQTTAARTVRLTISGTQSFPHSDFSFPSNGIFRAAEVSIIGTNDIFFQGLPATTAGFTILESWAGAGLVLQTGNAATPISFRTNRVERMRFFGSGGLFVGATPTDPGANNLAVQGSATIGGGTAVAKLKHGTATLSAGTVTVSDTDIVAGSRIFVNRQTDGGTVGDSYSVTLNAGTSFTITSKTANMTVALDTSTVSYLIINP
jgi:hypothetical protein